MLELELEDRRSTKRHKPDERLAESVTRIQMPTPRSTPLLVPSDGDSHSKASTEPSPGHLDHDSKRDGAGTPRSSASDLYTGNESGGGVHSLSTREALLHSSRKSIFRSEGIAGEHYITSDSERLGENREGSGVESHDEFNRDHELLPRPSAKASRRRKRSNRLLQKERHGSSRTTLGWQSPTRALRQGTSSQPQPLYRPPIDNRPLSCSPRALSPGTKAENNINHRLGVEMSYHITDFTLSAVPIGSSIMTAVVHFRDSKWPLNPAALGPKFLGGDAKVIRMTQLSPDSWMLLGYRCDNDASGPCTDRSLKADWTSESHSDATNQETNSLDDDWDEKSEKGEEGIETCGKRTHIPWLESDEVLLLSLKDKQGMEWEEIYKRFPGRTHPAVKLRYFMLRKKDR
jgi:hypothetical protein